jgi:hypothetical protein
MIYHDGSAEGLDPINMWWWTACLLETRKIKF